MDFGIFTMDPRYWFTQGLAWGLFVAILNPSYVKSGLKDPDLV
jgi:hypothetical protein